MGISLKDYEVLLGRSGRPAPSDRPTSSGFDASASIELFNRISKMSQPIVLDIEPMGAVRMSRSDRFRTDPHALDPRRRPRPCVVRYFDWKAKFVAEARRSDWTLSSVLRIHFELPMPKSWSKKKRAAMRGQIHQQKPDFDNLVKAVGDAFGVDDSFIWHGQVIKTWAERGRIIVFREPR